MISGIAKLGAAANDASKNPLTRQLMQFVGDMLREVLAEKLEAMEKLNLHAIDKNNIQYAAGVEDAASILRGNFAGSMEFDIEDMSQDRYSRTVAAIEAELSTSLPRALIPVIERSLPCRPTIRIRCTKRQGGIMKRRKRKPRPLWRPFFNTQYKDDDYVSDRTSGIMLAGWCLYGLMVHRGMIALILFNCSVGYWLDPETNEPPDGLERPYRVTFALYFAATWIALAVVASITTVMLISVIIQAVAPWV